MISYNEGDGSTRYIRLATKNLGANSSTEVGYYLSWGESEEKESYANNIYNFTNNKGYVLRPYEDPATILWGNEWRTPSSAELKFIKACATAYSIDDVNGRLIAGDNDAYTFMPAGGYKYNKEHRELNVSMGYWGNQISYSTYEDAISWYSLATIFNGEVIAGDLLDTKSLRSHGLNVRPVKRPNTKVSKTEASNITINGATLNATVILDELAEKDIESAYFELSVNQNDIKEIPATYNNGAFTVELTELTPSVTYTVSAVIKTAVDGYYYGEKSSFNTESEVEELEVDMGLSVIWAGWNLGAEKSSDQGDLYSWGEITSRGNDIEEYTYQNNFYSSKNANGPYPYTKYNDEDKISTLEAVDDAATVNLGEDWHTPTVEEWAELIENCDYEFVSRNGVSGRLFTSKINGKKLFFPKHKNRYEALYCYYWTSNIRLNIRDWEKKEHKYKYEYAHCIYMDNTYINTEGITDRSNAMPIRAVKTKKTK